MDVDELQRSFLEYATSLFNEEFLDAQFMQLKELQDESNPHFVDEVVSLFYENTDKLLNELTRILIGDQKTVDFNKVDAHVIQLQGSSCTIGAKRITKACIALRNICNEQNVEGCLTCLHQLRMEYLLMKSRFHTLSNLEKQIVEAGGVVPKLKKEIEKAGGVVPKVG